MKREYITPKTTEYTITTEFMLLALSSENITIDLVNPGIPAARESFDNNAIWDK